MQWAKLTTDLCVPSIVYHRSRHQRTHIYLNPRYAATGSVSRNDRDYDTNARFGRCYTDAWNAWLAQAFALDLNRQRPSNWRDWYRASMSDVFDGMIRNGGAGQDIASFRKSGMLQGPKPTRGTSTRQLSRLSHPPSLGLCLTRSHRA